MTWKPAETAPQRDVQVAFNFWNDEPTRVGIGRRFYDGSWFVGDPEATWNMRDPDILGWTELPDPPPAKVTE